MEIGSFSFCILCYNHESYILTHLNSIKYQILNYGKDIDFHLIITDDASKDSSILKIQNWIASNRNLFVNIETIFNSTNQGTCYNTKKIFQVVNTNYFKLTAGDDYYGSSNIFRAVQDNLDFDLLMGLPIRLGNKGLYTSKYEVFNFIASKFIYSNKSLRSRVERVSIINAPNLFYSRSIAKNKEVQNILDEFDVVEDWPLLVKISEILPSLKIKSLNTNFVIYRRTEQSTYLVENKRFVNDHIKVYNRLIFQSNGMFSKILLNNRKFLFQSNLKILKYLLNIAYLIYLIELIINLPKIIREYNSLELNLQEERKHLRGLNSSKIET